MREFNKALFFGDGDKVLIDCYKLHKRLDEGFEILGGIQQTPFDKKVVKKGFDELGEIVRDIAVSFNLRDIVNPPRKKK